MRLKYMNEYHDYFQIYFDCYIEGNMLKGTVVHRSFGPRDNPWGGVDKGNKANITSISKRNENVIYLTDKFVLLKHGYIIITKEGEYIHIEDD